MPLSVFIIPQYILFVNIFLKILQRLTKNTVYDIIASAAEKPLRHTINGGGCFLYPEEVKIFFVAFLTRGR